MGSAAAIAGGSIAGSLISKEASEDAAASRRKGTQAAIRSREKMFDKQLEFLREGREQAQQRMEPFREAGVSALQQYRNILEDPSALQDSAGLQFLQQQGQQQVESSASAKGMQLSGRTLGDLQERGQNVASQYRSQILGEIGELINVGQSSAAQQATTAFRGSSQAAQAAGSQGTALANLASQRGAINAAGDIGQGRALAGGVAGVTNAISAGGGLGNLFGGETSGVGAGTTPTHQSQRLRMMG